jgi:hypothetical protein
MRRAQRGGQGRFLGLRRFGALATVVTIATAGLLAGATAAGALPISVTPDSGLVDGQVVTVTGAGLTDAGGQVIVVECTAGVTAPTQCDLHALFVATAGAGGAYTASVSVLRILVSTDATVDCAAAPGSCVIAVATNGAGPALATVPLRFDTSVVEPPAVGVRDATAHEGDPFARAEVLLSHPSTQTVVVHYVTHHDTARPGSDYVRKDSRLVFLPGSVRHVVRIALVDDHVPERTESLILDLDRVERARTSDGRARITIVDDDGTPRS